MFNIVWPNPQHFPWHYGSVVRLFARMLQFVLALTVAGLYGVDLHRASQLHAAVDSRWAYAEFVAGLSAVSVFVYLAHLRWLFIVDLLLFIFWTALFGIFGKIYIPAHPTPKQTGQIRMKHAVWVDLVNMLLWFCTLLSGIAIFYVTRGESRTKHTGRAQV